MSDVSALVLSIGEPFVQRAVDSIARQTVPIAKVVTVEHVSPFYRALNQGARQVETPYFVQVDADMILDPSCVEQLRGLMAPKVAIAVGELRDALAGRAVGVKLFRTECFRQIVVPDSIAQETEFARLLAKRGWQTVYLADKNRLPSEPVPTIGEHRPDYTPVYTYRKLIIEGGKLRQRPARHGLFARMSNLEESPHPMALLAQLALGHGFFFASTRDELRPLEHDPHVDWLLSVLGSDLNADGLAAGLLPLGQARLGVVFGRFLEAGREIAATGAGGTLQTLFRGLTGTRHDARALVAKVALGHGLLMEADDLARLPADIEAFRVFMLYNLGRRRGPIDRARAYASFALGPYRKSRRYVPW